MNTRDVGVTCDRCGEPVMLAWTTACADCGAIHCDDCADGECECADYPAEDDVEEERAMETTNKVAQGLIDMAKRIESLESQVRALTAERDAQAEAVRVLGAEVNAAWNWNDEDMYDRPDTWDRATSDAVRANALARAAVEGGSK